ncbi:MAG: Flp pilus assembly protein CpaB [Candidatus Omnitrophica bacterium]|nr:Flp pilus assembly protein CpaB [Candidatus Omnitrophota bacterium]
MHAPQQAAPAVQVRPKTKVIGVIRDIKFGKIIQREDLDLLAEPPDADPRVLFTDFSQVVGNMALRNLHQGEVIKMGDVMAGGDNLAKIIPKGYRAITIPVTLPADLLNLIQMGNRADVILTYEQARGELKAVTLIENAKVIGASDPGGGITPDGQKRMFVTLAVTPVGAETLAYAVKKGTLTVSIRSMKDAESPEEKFFSLKDLFFAKDKTTTVPEIPRVQEIEIIRGLRREKFSTMIMDDQKKDVP